MAFAFTVTGTKTLDGAQVVYGTWDAASVTYGGVCFGAGFGTVSLTTTTASNTTLTTSGSYTTSGIVAGDLVYGVGIPTGTTVASVESATSLTLSKAATDATANARFFVRQNRAAGAPVKQAIRASVTNSVSSANTTVWNLINQNVISIGCASNDAGWWSVVLA